MLGFRSGEAVNGMKIRPKAKGKEEFTHSPVGIASWAVVSKHIDEVSSWLGSDESAMCERCVVA